MRFKVFLGLSAFILIITTLIALGTSLVLSNENSATDCIVSNTVMVNTSDTISSDIDIALFSRNLRINKENVHQVQEIKLLNVDAPVRSIAVSPDSSLILTYLPSGQVLAWNLVNDEKFVIALNDHNVELTSMAFSPNGQLVVFYGLWGRIALWDVTERDFITSSTETYSASMFHRIAFLDNSSLLYNRSRNLILCDLITGTENQILRTNRNDISAIGVHSEGNFVVYGTVGDSDSGGLPEQKIWSLSDQQILYDMPFHSLTITDIDISNNGERWVSGSRSGRIGAWSTQTGQLLGEIRDSELVSLEFGYNGDIVFTSHNNQNDEHSIFIQDVTDAENIFSLKGHDELITTLKLNTTGNILISGSLDGTIRLWGISLSDD